jgi:steroid delta-isomerase-like uncharacterized protein
MMPTTCIRLCTIIAAVASLTPAGCKRNQEAAEDTADDPVRVEGRRATDPRRSAQPRAEPSAENAIAAKYGVCVGFVNAANWQRFRSDCITDDFVLHEVDVRDVRGPDGLIEQLKNRKSAFPDAQLQPQLVMVSGKNILAIGMTTGTHQRPMKTPSGEIAPTDKKVGQLMFHRLAITSDLKAKEEWLYSDTVTLLSQLGQLPGDARAMRPAMEQGIEGAPITLIAADDEKERANVEVVRRTKAAFNGHNVNELVSFYAPDAVLSDQAMPEDLQGKTEIAKLNQDLLAAFSDARVEIPAMFAAGEYVVALGKFTGTNDADLPAMNLKKSGKKVEVSYADVIQLRQGKIARVWRFRDGMAVAKQTGTTAKPNKQARPTKQR